MLQASVNYCIFASLVEPVFVDDSVVKEVSAPELPCHTLSLIDASNNLSKHLLRCSLKQLLTKKPPSSCHLSWISDESSILAHPAYQRLALSTDNQMTGKASFSSPYLCHVALKWRTCTLPH